MSDICEDCKIEEAEMVCIVHSIRICPLCRNDDHRNCQVRALEQRNEAEAGGAAAIIPDDQRPGLPTDVTVPGQ